MKTFERGVVAVVAGDACLQLLGRPLDDHPAVVQDREPVAQAFGLLQVVGGEHDRRVVRRPAAPR